MTASRPQWFLATGLLLLISLAACRREDAAQAQTLRVQLAGNAAQPVSGRLLLFAMPAAEARAAAKDGKVVAVDTSPFKPTQVSVAAMEVTHLAPGASVTVDTETLAFPAAFSKLKPGEYAMQAVLDVNHDYNYGGRGAGDWVSDVATVKLGDGVIAPIALSHALPGASGPTWELPADAPKETKDDAAAARPHAEPLDFISPALSAFWDGRRMSAAGYCFRPITPRIRNCAIPPSITRTDSAASCRI